MPNKDLCWIFWSLSDRNYLTVKMLVWNIWNKAWVYHSACIHDRIYNLKLILLSHFLIRFQFKDRLWTEYLYYYSLLGPVSIYIPSFYVFGFPLQPILPLHWAYTDKMASLYWDGLCVHICLCLTSRSNPMREDVTSITVTSSFNGHAIP